MSQKTRSRIIMLRMAEALIACFTIWFGGWLLYDILELWLYCTSIRFQHLLLTLITIVLLVVCELSRKSTSNTTMQTPEESEKATEQAESKPEKKKKPRRSLKSAEKCETTSGCMEPKENSELEELKVQVKELKTQVADMHAFDQVKQKREESAHA